MKKLFQSWVGLAAALVLIFGGLALMTNGASEMANASQRSMTYSSQIQTPTGNCTPLTIRYWVLAKRIVPGPGGPEDASTFIQAGIKLRRGCKILSGRAVLNLQFHYKDPDGKYRWRSIAHANAAANLKGEAHTLLDILVPVDHEPNCTGTEGHYRIKLNLSPGEVELDGQTYHMPPAIWYHPVPADDGKFFDCKNASSK